MLWVPLARTQTAVASPPRVDRRQRVEEVGAALRDRHRRPEGAAPAAATAARTIGRRRCPRPGDDRGALVVHRDFGNSGLSLPLLTSRGGEGAARRAGSTTATKSSRQPRRGARRPSRRRSGATSSTGVRRCAPGARVAERREGAARRPSRPGRCGPAPSLRAQTAIALPAASVADLGGAASSPRRRSVPGREAAPGAGPSRLDDVVGRRRSRPDDGHVAGRVDRRAGSAGELAIPLFPVLLLLSGLPAGRRPPRRRDPPRGEKPPPAGRTEAIDEGGVGASEGGWVFGSLPQTSLSSPESGSIRVQVIATAPPVADRDPDFLRDHCRRRRVDGDRSREAPPAAGSPLDHVVAGGRRFRSASRPRPLRRPASSPARGSVGF